MPSDDRWQKNSEDDASRRQRETNQPYALANGDPTGQRPQRDADTEKIVHQADEEDIVID